MIQETFGEYIHNLRVEKNLTLTKLAAALDIDQSTLSKIENCKRNVPEEIIPKLAVFFNLDIKSLEKEFYSEKIAEILHKGDNPKELLILAEKKAKCFQIKKMQQGILKF